MTSLSLLLAGASALPLLAAGGAHLLLRRRNGPGPRTGTPGEGLADLVDPRTVSDLGLVALAATLLLAVLPEGRLLAPVLWAAGLWTIHASAVTRARYAAILHREAAAYLVAQDPNVQVVGWDKDVATDLDRENVVRLYCLDEGGRFVLTWSSVLHADGSQRTRRRIEQGWGGAVLKAVDKQGPVLEGGLA